MDLRRCLAPRGLCGYWIGIQQMAILVGTRWGRFSMSSMASVPSPTQQFQLLPGMTNIGDARRENLEQNPHRIDLFGRDVEGIMNLRTFWHQLKLPQNFQHGQYPSCYPPFFARHNPIHWACPPVRRALGGSQGQPWSSTCYIAFDGSCWIFCLWHLFRQGKTFHNHGVWQNLFFFAR